VIGAHKTADNEDAGKKVDVKSWIYGIWFMVRKDGKADFAGKLMRTDHKWVFDYRLRYYAPDSTDPFDGKDTKQRYRAWMADDSDASFKRALQALQDFFAQAREIGFENVQFVLLECFEDDPKIIFELGSKPWAHIKRIVSRQADYDLIKTN
jgi:hypothetical protein